jgi:hypothetical protein
MNSRSGTKGGKKQTENIDSRTQEVSEARKFESEGEQSRKQGTIRKHDISQPREWIAGPIDGLIVYK